MRKRISVEEFGEQFSTVKQSSWRWECQGDYPIDHESMKKWLAKEPISQEEYKEDSEWLLYIQGLNEAGIPFERARMVTEPLTDYLAWMLAVTNSNIDAGEDIRWCKESSIRDLGMPDYDFYIFDDNRVVIFHHDENKIFTHAELVDDEASVAAHRALREKVWPHAVPHREFLFETIKNGVYH